MISTSMLSIIKVDLIQFLGLTLMKMQQIE